MQPIEIRLKKGKLAFVLFMLSGLLIPMGLWFFTSGLEATMVGEQIFFLGIGVPILIVTALLVPFGLMRLANKAPGLIIDEHGLIDYSAAFPNGFVAWSDIRAIEVAQPEQTTMMFIVLFDPEKYLKTKSSIRRAFARIGDRFGYPSYFGIVIGNLNIEFAELITVVEQYWGEYQQRANTAETPVEEFRA